MSIARFAFIVWILLPVSAKAFDIVQFTTNHIWCWQHDHALIGRNDPETAQACREGWMPACRIRDGQPHSDYIAETMKNYGNPNLTLEIRAARLRDGYRFCQHHNSRALDYRTVSDADVIRGVRHMIGCYPARRGALRLADGQSSSVEAQSVGIRNCSPL